jgi:hypothetical protein
MFYLLAVRFYSLIVANIPDFDQDSLQRAGLQPGNIVSSIWTLFVGNIMHKSSIVVQGATRGLGSLLIRMPRLFASESSRRIVRFAFIFFISNNIVDC